MSREFFQGNREGETLSEGGMMALEGGDVVSREEAEQAGFSVDGEGRLMVPVSVIKETARLMASLLSETSRGEVASPVIGFTNQMKLAFRVLSNLSFREVSKLFSDVCVDPEVLAKRELAAAVEGEEGGGGINPEVQARRDMLAEFDRG